MSGEKDDLKLRWVISFKKFLETHSPSHYSLLLAIPLVLYVAGYLIWETYLFTFGFTATEIIRGQFVLTGFTFSFVSVYVIGICNAIYRLLKYLFSKILWFKRPSVVSDFFTIVRMAAVATLVLAWSIYYVINVFPNLPLYLGGGQPRALSLITTKESMALLNSVDIVIAAGATNQTENLCIIYDDNQTIYVARNDRVLALDHTLFQGFGSLPGPNAVYAQSCLDQALEWSHQGFQSGRYLLEAKALNFFRGIFGFPSRQLAVQLICPSPPTQK